MAKEHRTAQQTSQQQPQQLQQQGQPVDKKGDFLKPTAEQVLQASESLYDDELRPFGRILLKRLRERIAADLSTETGSPVDVEDVPLIDPKYLRKVCETSPYFRIGPAEGREYAVSLDGRQPVFVDPCSPVDTYPPQIWRGAAAYFGSQDPDSSTLPSGRYACAQVLMARGLPFLKNRSLGEVCHIVQLAISQKKILGYADGKLVPYSRSEEYTKERCAKRQQPVGAATDELPFTSWQDLRRGLHEILATSCNPAPGSVTLSNVKRLFRAQLGLELSETVLGHSRVWELLQDARLHDVCVVEAFGSGQAIVKAVDFMPSMSAHFHALAAMQSAQSAYFNAMQHQHPGMVCPSTCASNRYLMPIAPQLPLGPRVGSRAAGQLLSVPPPAAQPGQSVQPQRPPAQSTSLPRPVGCFIAATGAAAPGPLPRLPVQKTCSAQCTPQFQSEDASTVPPSSAPGSATLPPSSAPGSATLPTRRWSETETASTCGGTSPEDLDISSLRFGQPRQADGDFSVLLKVQKVLGMSSQAEEDEDEDDDSDIDKASQDYIVKNTFVEMSPGVNHEQYTGSGSSKRSQSVPRSFWLPTDLLDA